MRRGAGPPARPPAAAPAERRGRPEAEREVRAETERPDPGNKNRHAATGARSQSSSQSHTSRPRET